MRQWQLQAAKARLSELVKRARTEGPQGITLHGEPAVVVLSAAEYRKLTVEQPTLVRFLADSPLVGMDLDIERDRSPVRDIDL